MAKSMVERIKECMHHKDRIRNVCVIAHVDHGKTTMVDSLLAGCGMISYEVAGEKLAMDYFAVEQEKGVTIKSADVNMVHEYKGKEYLINLVDTPGHVDFGGHVTRAVRVADGAIVVVDAVEGVMPQTEMVLRQALKEYVKPVLFINKCDRLITELKLKPNQIIERFMRIIKDVNDLIRKYAPKEFKDKWLIRAEQGNVAFGSARDKWGLTIPLIKQTGISFKDVVEAYRKGEEAVKELSYKIPLYKVILDMIIAHLPNPAEAQAYRIKGIWKGDLDSDVGKALMLCDEKAPAIACINKIIMDPHAGEIAVGRTFSGTFKTGMEVYLWKAKTKATVQQLYVWKGNQRFIVDEVPAGNIVGFYGLRNVTSGETVSEVPIDYPFEEIRHLFEPVVTKAFEPKDPRELQRLAMALRKLSKEDPTIKVQINEETGEILVSGLGEFHLEILEQFHLKERLGIEVVTGNPIVVYRETITKESPVMEGKSPNKHNKIYIRVRPLPKEIIEAIRSGELPEGRVKGRRAEAIWSKLVELGIPRQEAKRCLSIYGYNLFFDMTRGVVHIGEIIEMCLKAFEQVMDEGPLAREKCMGIRVDLVDAVLHEDAIHRGPAQIIPATRFAIKEAIKQAGPLLYEPVQTIRIDTPPEYIGSVIGIIQGRRGAILEIKQEEDRSVLIAKLPVAESFGFTSELRSATMGKAIWFLVDSRFEKLPMELQEKVIKQIRERKGISE